MNIDMIDMNLLFILLGAVGGILGLGLAIYGITTWVKSGKKISTRLDQFVTDPSIQSAGHENDRQIIPREISGSLLNRTIIRWFKNFLRFLGKFTPQNTIADIDRKLTIAGNPYNLRATDFYAIRFLVLLGGILLAYLINRDFNNVNMTNVGLGGLVVGLCLLFPNIWLKKQAESRQDEIQRGLPDALDMLSVCASAGLGFDQSLQKISHYWDTELGHELNRTTHEMEMGASRTEALRNLMNRLDVDDLSRFVVLIIQAEMIGMSYADILHSQAEQLRILRQFRAREIANKLPAKMIMPLALTIFPAMIAVILGPAIPTLLDLF